jgi:polar amino acid transport system substrate-binding protein
MESKGMIMAVVMLIIGLGVGLGGGYFLGYDLGYAAGYEPPPEPEDDYDRIVADGTMIVGTNSGWPPFEMVNATTGDLYGFDIDLAQLCADYIGVTITWVDMDFDALVGACETGTIDMIASATFITAARCEVLEPLCWYIRTNEVVVTLADSTLEIDSLDDLVGYTVGVQTGTTEDEGLSDIDGITLVRYPVVETMFQDLDSGDLDAVFVDEPIVGLYGEIYSLKIIFTNPAPPTAFYIRYGNPKLSGAFNSAIAEAFADGSLVELIEKWFA